MMKNIRILYMGTPELSSIILKGLIDKGYNIVGVVAQEDKPVGRKGIIEPVPTKKVALENNIPVFQPKKIRDDFSFIKELNIDLIITCAYGQIIPQEVLDLPTIDSINVHGSLLPKYRGASPIQQSLINGDEYTGVTIMKMIYKMDAGDMIHQKSFKIEKDDNYTSLCQKIARCGLDALIEILPSIIDRTAKYIPQEEELVTYCSKITKEQEHLDLNNSAKNVLGWIKALSETPGAFTYLDNQVFKIYDAEVVPLNGPVGQIIQADNKGLIVACKNDALSLKIIQKQGKKKMDYKSLINGDRTLLNNILK